jgi:alkylhydroperoxidase family enzyme
MAFFELPTDEDLPPESRKLLDEYQGVSGAKELSVHWRLFGRFPKFIEARLLAYKNLGRDTSFSFDARSVAIMLIAHAKRCQMFFAGARSELNKLGFDEGALDAMCANPNALPLKERDRRFVLFALRIATDSANLTPKDFHEMEKAGFSKDEILEIIAFAAYWTMNIVFSTSGLAGLTDE